MLGQAAGLSFKGVRMYTMLDNRSASRFDQYLSGQLVASLHYCIDENEILFVFCEALESVEADRHCEELMQSAVAESLNRHFKITVTCPIARDHLRQAVMGSKQHGRALSHKG